MGYKDFNLKKIDSRILQDFDEVKELPDNSKALIRYSFSLEHKKLIDIKTIIKGIEENKKEVETLIILYRSSINWYVATVYTAEGVNIKYFSNIETIGAFIKANYCKTIAKEINQCTL